MIFRLNSSLPNQVHLIKFAQCKFANFESSPTIN